MSFTVPNLHSSEDAFWPCVLVAFMLHAGLWGVWQLVPNVETVIVPVKALSIRLGESEAIVPQAAAAPAQINTAQPAKQEAAPKQAAPANTGGQPSITSTAKPQPKQNKKEEEDIAKRYVRKAAVPKGSVYGDSTATEAEMLARYEQLISSSIHRYRIYPATARRKGLEGDGVVRVRINRDGKILYYGVENSTGEKELDDAMLAMVRQANPVPKVPANYPSGTLIEFLIPVSFALENQ